MILRDYQSKLLEDIEKSTAQRLCVQLATGGGKTIIFSTLAKKYEGRVLILVDSKELVQQTVRNFTDAATFEAKDKIFPNDRIVISMVQTLKSRLKKQPYLIDNFDLIIIDECHIISYESILDIVNCKVIGFTATPVHNKVDNYYYCFEHQTMEKTKDTCKCEKVEFTKPFSLSELFEDIIIGIPISELIKQGYLMPEENYVIPIDDSKFKFDAFGEVTEDSSNEVFDVRYQMDVLGNYLAHCQEKKTLIFTQNTTLNLAIYKQFIDNGIENVFMYDSSNLDLEYNRKEVVEKFDNTPGAILLNVGCFTKGFDVTDVEAIIISRRVSSLSLFIQMVGRGSRPTKKIFKDKFIVIDGGTNIERLGLWSDEYDWNKLFWGTDNYKPKKEPIEEEVVECKNCAQLMPSKTCECPNCEFNNCEIKEIQIEFAIAKPLNIIYPNADKIIEYSKDKDKFFALKVLTNQIFDMFKNIPKEQFERNINLGVERVFKTHLKPNYIKIINSNLPSKSNRTYSKQKDILLTKLKKKYDI